MVDIILQDDNKFKLTVKGRSDEQKKDFRELIKKIPGYEYVRSGDYYLVPLIELNSIITILGNKRNFLGDKQYIIDKYSKVTSEFKASLMHYNPANFLKSIDTNISYPFLKLPPKEFQKLAIEWASVKKGSAQIYGGLIADEVGLGKTFESIATICKLREQGICEKGIIICTAGTKPQWADEINRFSNLTYKIIDSDTKKKRLKGYNEFNETFLIINYELYRNDAEDIQNLKTINKNLDFSFIIVDEAHKMKDINSENYKKISLINPPVKLILTATPIKKDVQDLFALFNYISPDILMGWHYFKNKFLKFTVKFGREICIGGKTENRQYLHLLIAPYMIRRKSTDVSNEIPLLEEQFIFLKPTREQDKWFKLLNAEMDKAYKLAEIAYKEDKLKLAQLRENAFRARFQALLPCSDHLALLTLSKSKSMERLIDKHKIIDFKSPKLDWLINFIEDNIIQDNEFFNEKKEKLVIFTQFERMVGLIEKAIENKLLKKYPNSVKYMRFTGQMDKTCPRVSKDKLVKNCFECSRAKECKSREKSKYLFVNDESVNVLICNDAGQEGINLQVARYLVNYDILWAPGSLEQRNGRIKRIGSPYGQVKVYNLCIEGSLDEKIVSKLKIRRDHIRHIVESSKAEKEAYAEHLTEI